MVLLDECRIFYLRHLFSPISVIFVQILIMLRFFLGIGFGNEFCSLIAVLVQVADGADILVGMGYPSIGDRWRVLYTGIVVYLVAVLTFIDLKMRLDLTNIILSLCMLIIWELIWVLLQRHIILLIITPKAFTISQNSRIHLSRVFHLILFILHIQNLINKCYLIESIRIHFFMIKHLPIFVLFLWPFLVLLLRGAIWRIFLLFWSYGM